MKIALRTVTATFSAAMIIAGAAQAQDLAQNKAETLNYTVLRDGKNIGTHAVTIEHKGSETDVSVKTDITVKMLFVTAYKFKHASQEMWNNGQLISLTSTTDDDGTPKELTARAENGVLTLDSTVKGQERRQQADVGTEPASLWNPDTVKQSALLNTLDGQMMQIKVKDLGTENVDASGAALSAHHYSLTGDLTRELWFDDAGRLVRMRFPDKTNTEIIYALN
jgi:hypothetical protein